MKRIVLLILATALPLWAQGPAVNGITWTQLNDTTWKGHLTLTSPAPPEGAKVIFEPTFHFEFPTTLMVPPGQTSADFNITLVDNTFMSGFTGIGEAGIGSASDVTTFLNGKLWMGPAPDRR